MSYKSIYPLLLGILHFTFHCCLSQQQVTSMATSNSTAPATSYSGVKGAGLKNSGNGLASNWDSTGTSFTINYSTTASNITKVTQFMVSGHASPFLPISFSNAIIKVRRLANSYVTDTRNYFNFWANYSSTIPVKGATTGIFNIIPPEVTDVETSFLTNNINSGIDNIFQNNVNHLHANNIERVDFILLNGLTTFAQASLDGTGVLTIDRGTGDPFNIAVILSVDANNNPLTYGPLISVSASQFGGSLL